MKGSVKKPSKRQDPYIESPTCEPLGKPQIKGLAMIMHFLKLKWRNNPWVGSIPTAQLTHTVLICLYRQRAWTTARQLRLNNACKPFKHVHKWAPKFNPMGQNTYPLREKVTCSLVYPRFVIHVTYSCLDSSRWLYWRTTLTSFAFYVVCKPFKHVYKWAQNFNPMGQNTSIDL